MRKGTEMPHIIVKLWPESQDQKQALADRITTGVMEVLHYGENSVSVAIEEISAADWPEKVYRPDIVNTPGKLYNNRVTGCNPPGGCK
jgi:4-oxalocrotonate tautomerase